jgi:FkbM family methyltransferase
MFRSGFSRKNRLVLFKHYTATVATARIIGHCDWIPMGARLRLANIIHNAESSPSVPFEVEFFGRLYPGNLNCFVDWHVYFFGAYEKPTLLFLRELMASRSEHPIVLDVGANVGHHTLFFSKWAGHVHAFEPWGTVRQEIFRKIETNRLKNVSVHGVGLGDKRESLPYYAPLGANTGTGSFLSTHATDRNRPFGTLQLVNGDEYLRERKIVDVDLIKVDVEGWEMYVLWGLRDTLRRYRPIVFIEISDSTLRTLNGIDDFRGRIPEGYEAMYVNISRRNVVSYSQFDASRPGDALLRPI